MSLGTGKPWELYIWIMLSSSDEKSPESPSRPFAVCDTFVILVHVVTSPGSDLCRYKHYNEQELGCIWPAARELTDCWGDASLYEKKEYSFKSQKLALIEGRIMNSCSACHGQLSLFWNCCLDWQTARPLVEIFWASFFWGVECCWLWTVEQILVVWRLSVNILYFLELLPFPTCDSFCWAQFALLWLMADVQEVWWIPVICVFWGWSHPQLYS